MCLNAEMKKWYREYLEQLVASGSSETFTNGGKDHAVVLYSVIFNNTRKKARIFCEGAHSEIWQDPDFIEAFTKMIEEGNATVNILVENVDDNVDAPFPSYLEALVKKYPNRIEIRKAAQHDLDQIVENYGSDNVNFSVFDEKILRFEYDKRSYKAYGSFNNENLADSLAVFFDGMYSRGETVEFVDERIFDVEFTSVSKDEMIKMDYESWL